MKIIIDTNISNTEGYSLSEILYLISLYYNNQINDAVVEKLHHLGLVNVRKMEEPDEVENFRYKNCYISVKGGDLITRVLYESNKESIKDKSPKSNEFIYWQDVAKAMQKEYPTGKKPGTNYQWRDSSTIIADRLKKVFNRIPDKYSKEAIVAATKSYVQSFNGNYTYMQLLKYFISKKVPKDGQYEDSSQLLSYLENAGQECITNQDWTSTLR